jgi:hypothetical protein
MGLNEKLRAVATTGVEPTLAACAVMVAAGDADEEPLGAVRSTLRRLERDGASVERARGTG